MSLYLHCFINVLNKFDIEPGSSVITNPRIRGILDTDYAKCENPV